MSGKERRGGEKDIDIRGEFGGGGGEVGEQPKCMVTAPSRPN